MLALVFSDLRRHRAGVLALVVLIALASALGVAVNLGERAVRLGSARASAAFDLVIGAPGSETQLVLSTVFLQPAPLPLVPGRTLAALRADPRVAVAAPVGFGDFAGDDPVVGTTRDVVAALGGLSQGAGFARLNEAVAGSAVDRAIGSTFVPLHGRADEGGHAHREARYRIVGRMAPTGTPWDRAILVPIQAVWHVHEDHEDHHEHEAAPTGAAGNTEPARGADHEAADAEWTAELDDAALLRDDAPGVPAIVVKPRTIADAYRLRGAYRNDASLAVFPAEVLTRLYATLGDARVLLALVAVGAQALVAGAILLTIVVHVLGRRRQIGALRAFGAPGRAIFAVVWLEIMLVALLGIGIGFLAGTASARLLAVAIEARSGIALPVVFERADAGAQLALLAFAGLVALLPAFLAYRQPPTTALRAG